MRPPLLGLAKSIFFSFTADLHAKIQHFHVIDRVVLETAEGLSGLLGNKGTLSSISREQKIFWDQFERTRDISNTSREL